MALTAYSLSTAPLGVSVFRDDSVAVPALYKPSLVCTAVKNKSGSNVNVTIKSTYPLPTQKDGKWLKGDQFNIRTSLNALQNVTNATERAAILDEHIKFLTKYKDSLMAGAVPTK